MFRPINKNKMEVQFVLWDYNTILDNETQFTLNIFDTFIMIYIGKLSYILTCNTMVQI